MKWIKFDPENPPLGMVLFRFEAKGGSFYLMGYFRWPSCVLYAASIQVFSLDDMNECNAHYIYPKDLEMPE